MKNVKWKREQKKRRKEEKKKREYELELTNFINQKFLGQLKQG